MTTKLNVFKVGSGDGSLFPDFVARKSAELKQGKIERLDELCLHVFSHKVITSKFISLLFCFIFSRKLYLVCSQTKGALRITLLYLIKELGSFLVDTVLGVVVKCFFEVYVRYLRGFGAVPHKDSKVGVITKCLYIRAPLWFGLEAGGSIAHSAGVINSMRKLFEVDVFATDYVQTVSGSQRLFNLPKLFWNSRTALHYWTSLTFYKQIPKENYSFIYQRYSAFDLTGLLTSIKRRVPLVLEYNGSEIWIAENWGKTYSNRKVGLIVEELCLRYSHQIIVVSEALKKELIGRGVSSQKITVYPNCVDIDFFNNLDSSESECSVGDHFESDTFYFGFIGTFGKWHGVPLLVQAFEHFLRSNIKHEAECKLLLIGSGPEFEMVKELAERSQFSERIVLAGSIPQAIAPYYLNRCNVLVAPTLDNSDGSEFIGSPTKIFEYMALEKVIVCSPVGQIGSVITNGVNGIIFNAGSVESLSHALAHAYNDFSSLHHLAVRAKNDVSKNYTWDIHVQKIIKNL